MPNTNEVVGRGVFAYDYDMTRRRLLPAPIPKLRRIEFAAAVTDTVRIRRVAINKHPLPIGESQFPIIGVADKDIAQGG